MLGLNSSYTPYRPTVKFSIHFKGGEDFCQLGKEYSTAPRYASYTFFYAPQLYRQVLLRRVLAMGILSVRLSVCHDPVVYQAQVR